MTRRTLQFAAVLFAFAVPALAQDARCGAGRDLVVQALERAGPTSSSADFEDALQLLKRANSVCAELGDAWYYRSLVEARLNHAPLAKFAADKARMFHSEAQADDLQPFVLSTPLISTRGLTPSAKPATPPPDAPKTAGPVQQKWALVIGVSRFADHSIPALHYTAADALAFAAILTDPTVGRFPKANVHTLTDAQATTRNIKQQLNWIARQAGPDDIVVLYLATHGSPRKLDSVAGLNYLITYDTEINSADQPDEDALYASALPMVELSSAVATRLKSLRTLVVLDTCYSGGAASSSRMMGSGLANAAPSPETLARMSQGAGRLIFAASRVDQESLESNELQHGYFTYFLLKALRETKGAAPLSQVFATVQQQVSARVSQDHHASVNQNPVMDRSSANADFILAAPAATAQRNPATGSIVAQAVP